MKFLEQQWRKLSSCFPEGGQSVHVESFTLFGLVIVHLWMKVLSGTFFFLQRYLSSWEAWHSSLGEWSVAEPWSAGSSQTGGGCWVILPLGLLAQLYWPPLIPIRNSGLDWTGSLTVSEIKNGRWIDSRSVQTRSSATGNALRHQLWCQTKWPNFSARVLIFSTVSNELKHILHKGPDIE